MYNRTNLTHARYSLCRLTTTPLLLFGTQIATTTTTVHQYDYYTTQYNGHRNTIHRHDRTRLPSQCPRRHIGTLILLYQTRHYDLDVSSRPQTTGTTAGHEEIQFVPSQTILRTRCHGTTSNTVVVHFTQLYKEEPSKKPETTYSSPPYSDTVSYNARLYLSSHYYYKLKITLYLRLFLSSHLSAAGRS